MSGIEGLEQLNKLAYDFRQAGLTAIPRARQLVRKTAFDISATAKTFVPVDTSATRESIDADFEDGDLTAIIGPTTLYAWWLEFGTSRMAPHAFMGPSLDIHSPEFAAGAAELGANIL